ncbi:MAG: aspartate aminotransferase family protein [Deltaproteobacteria bacterium]|nr:MAG: aspartate aminotransferase family protein [Deltaproteobacteria bacterium]
MKGFDEIRETSGKVFFPTYNRYAAAMERGEGAYLFDTEGKRYLDFLSGIGVMNLGHAHPEIAEAICEQAKGLVHVSNLYFMPPQTELADQLVRHSSLDRVFFCNSGAEANEAAIKLARKYARETYGDNRFEIITLEDSFHGRTLATVSATGQEKVKKGFAPLLDGFTHVPAGDFGVLERAVSERTCAIMMEPILGEGGAVVLPNRYLRDVRHLCSDRDIVLIMDEIQVGMGRTGKLFAHQWAEIEPDVMTLAKALGGGLPLGAMLAKEKYAETLGAGSHGSTFGGNPVACRAGLVVMKHVTDETFLGLVLEMGDLIRARFNEMAARFGFIEEVRGRGLIVGIKLSVPCKEMVAKAFERGLLINCTQESVLRMLPPLIISEKEVEEMFKILEDIFEEV